MELRQALEVYKAKGKTQEWFECCLALKDRELMKEFQRAMAKDKEMVYFRKSCLALAKEDFDSFMLYTEWDRPIREQFWLPRRKKLRVICDALQDMEDDKLDELFLSMPPRTGKSTLINFFLLWVILRDSEKSNLYCSYTDGVVNAFYNGLIEMLSDKVTYKWQEVFPLSVAGTNSKNLTFNIERRKRYSSFTGRSLYGSLNGACDCSGYVIGDDLHSGIEEALNKDRLNTAWNRVDNNLLPRAKESAKRIWIGTRWSLIDAIGRRLDLLENDSKYKGVRYKVINIPALDENDESNFNYEFGVGFTTEYYQQRRASFERNNDMASWWAQYMGSPIERDGTVFLPDDLRYFNGVLPDVDPDRKFMAVDPAWGGGDFVAAPIIYQFGNDLYVVDVVYDNHDKTITQPLVANKAIKWNLQAMKVEATKQTASYAEGINNILQSKGHRLNMETNVKHFTGTGKQQRIFDKAPDIRENMIFLNEGLRSKEYSMFMQNLYSFQFDRKNQHDDAPDSLAMAIDMAFMSDNTAVIMKRNF